MGKFGIPAKHHEAIALIYAKVSLNNRQFFYSMFFLMFYNLNQTLLNVENLNGHVLYSVPKSYLPIVIVIMIIITKILFNRMLVLPTTRQPSTILAWLPTTTSVKTG